MWIVAWLVVFDVLVGWLCARPVDPRLAPSPLADYFERGRSVEGKLRAMVGPTDDTSHWIVKNGWLDSLPLKPQPTRPSDASKVLVADYGQSFSEHVVNAALGLAPELEARHVLAPGAPLAHSFAAYQIDRQRQQAKIVTIGVLGSRLPLLATMTSMTWGFEFAAPYTYPRYELVSGRLQVRETSIRSSGALRNALFHPTEWSAFRDELVAHDEAFDSLTFDRDLLDRSVIGRLVRRALGQAHQRDFEARFRDVHGFRNEANMLDVAEALLVEFARSAREDGRLPYVFLFNDQGYSDYLTRALGPRLARHDIPFVDSLADVPVNDPKSFIPDGHYRPDLEERIAARWIADLKSRGVLGDSAQKP